MDMSLSLEFMTNFRKVRSGLPINVKLDNGEAYKQGGHGHILMFQTNRQNQCTNTELVIMTISDTPTVIGEHKLSARVIRELEDFVKKNKNLLIQLADMEIDYIDFIEQMSCKKPKFEYDRKELELEIDQAVSILEIEGLFGSERQDKAIKNEIRKRKKKNDFRSN